MSAKFPVVIIFFFMFSTRSPVFFFDCSWPHQYPHCSYSVSFQIIDEFVILGSSFHVICFMFCTYWFLIFPHFFTLVLADHPSRAQRTWTRVSTVCHFNNDTVRPCHDVRDSATTAHRSWNANRTCADIDWIQYRNKVSSRSRKIKFFGKKSALPDLFEERAWSSKLL